MRLLVYGGNLYEERRRIGAWSKAITAELLQDRYGLSERKPAFGVGILDDTPFLIFRKIQPHKDRSYPLTVLLDPGEAVWLTYDWNAAHLMHTLFIESDSPGRKLLHEAEKFHSEQDLERLFQEVGRQELPSVEVSTDEEKVWQLWFASLTSAEPVIASPDGKVIGLNARPLLANMARLMSKVRPTLRCGKGWLIGGSLSLVKPFGVHFVFDDGKTPANTGEAGKQTLEALRQSEEQFAAYKTVRDDEHLTDFFKHHLWQWEKLTGHTAEEFFSDLKFLASLSQTTVVRSGDDFDRVLEDVVERLENGKGPLYEPICEAASNMAHAGAGQFTPAQTRFLLFYAWENKKPVDKEAAEGLHTATAIEFFVNRRLYPSEAGDLMPETFRVEVCRRLLEQEETPDRIPQLLRGEIKSLERSERQSLEGLIELAVRRSTESSLSLTELWSDSASEALLGPLLAPSTRQAARSAFVREMNNSVGGSTEATAQTKSSWLEDYLLFGADSGGNWVASQNFNQQSIARLVRLIIKASTLGSSPSYRSSAEDWLGDLAWSNLRASVRVEEKSDIVTSVAAKSTNDNLDRRWNAYNNLQQLFELKIRRPAHSAIGLVKNRAEEREHLLLELQQLASGILQHNEGQFYNAPSIEGLLELLGGGHAEIAWALLSMRPDLSNESSHQWLRGWLELAEMQEKSGIEGHSHKKYQKEWTRFLLESDSSITVDEKLSSPERLANFEPGILEGLFDALLFDGGERQDERYANRLTEVLKIGDKKAAVQKSLQDSFDRTMVGTKRAEFLRRYANQKESLKRLNKALTVEQQRRLTEILEQHKREEIRVYRDRILELMVRIPMREFEQSFLQLKHAGKELFKEGLNEAFSEMKDDTQIRQLFLQRFVINKTSARVLREALPFELKEIFKEWIFVQEQERLRMEIRRLLYEDNAEADVDSRTQLREMLKKKSIEGMRLAVEAEVIDGISDPHQFNNFKRRFIQMNRAYRSKEDDLKVIDSIFEKLEWKTQKTILISLYEADKDAFKGMAESICYERQKENIALSFFQIAVLKFLKTDHPVAKNVKHQLVIYTSKREIETILNRVNDPEPATGSIEEEAQLPAEEADGQRERKGLFSKATSRVGKFLGLGRKDE